MTKLQNRATRPSYSVVIATCDREKELARVLDDWAAQTVKPEKVVVVRARGTRHEARGNGREPMSESGKVRNWEGGKRAEKEHEARGAGQEARGRQPEAAEARSLEIEDGFPDLRSPISDLRLVQLTADERSAAKQRNLGAKEVESEWIVFCDDDVRFGPELAEKTLGFLQEHRDAVAVSPRMKNSGHPVPGRLLHGYYRLQAGFDDETFGAKLFGPGLSCYPCWEKQTSPVETMWLPSTMLWMKTELFKRHEFPDFEGYSFGEDAHLTHRVWREVSTSGNKIYFLAAPEFDHVSVQSGVKASRFHLGRMTIRNQKRIAREAMSKSCWEVFWKSLLHRAFMTVALAKSRRQGWIGEMMGVWVG